MKAKKTILLFIFLCFIGSLSFGQQTTEETTYNKIKAAYVYAFTKYFDWPLKNEPLKKFRITVLNSKNNNSFYQELKKYNGKIIGGLSTEITEFSSTDEIKDVPQILYYNGNDFDAESVYNYTKGKGVLIIAENVKNYSLSMITFVAINEKIKFTLNEKLCQRENLKINEKLTALAIIKNEDWASTYSMFEKYEQQLKSSDKTFVVSKEELTGIVNDHKSQKETNNKQSIELQKLNSQVLKMENEISAKELELSLINDQLSKKQRDIVQKQLDIQQKSIELDSQKTFLKENTKKIQSANNLIMVNKRVLDMQQNKIAEQKDLLGSKEELINTQKKSLLAGFAFIVIIIISSIFLVKNIIARKKANKILEQQKLELAAQKSKVDEAFEELRQQNEEISAQRDEIENQKDIIQEHQREIVDSITYAKHIQDAILPPIELIKEKLRESFVLYKPKDIVAGDFYWMEEIELADNNEISNKLILIAAADCTGHGVPGAMVSVVCSNALNRAVKEFGLIEPGKILDKVTDLVIETFEKSSTDVKDGMDISMLAINKNAKQINWSGANNPLWYWNETGLKEIKADKQPIGKSDNRKPFTNHALEYKPGTIFYLFTDGYADQFGGPKGKKFKYKAFQELLASNIDKDAAIQQSLLNTTFENWKGKLEQVDDVCVIGIKI